MARLPTPGGDDGTWGDILNEYLSVSHDSGGALNTNSVGSTQLQTGAVTSTKIASGAVTKSDVGLANADNTSDANKPVSTAQQTALNAKISLGGTTALAPQTATVHTFTIVDDNSSSGTWPDRLGFRYDDTAHADHYTSWFNEFGELRIIPAKTNTVAFRIFTKDVTASTSHDAGIPVFEIVYNRDVRTPYHEMYSNGNFYHSGAGTVGGALAVTGDVTAPNIGEKVVTWATGSEPSLTGVPDGTLWIEYTP